MRPSRLTVTSVLCFLSLSRSLLRTHPSLTHNQMFPMHHKKTKTKTQGHVQYVAHGGAAHDKVNKANRHADELRHRRG